MCEFINDIINELNKLSITDVDEVKQMIKDSFDAKLKGKKFDSSMKKHCGSEGNWIETQFKEGVNSNINSDYHGFEIKKESPKITFGDWSADEYIFNPKDILKKYNQDINISKDDFLEMFGHLNVIKQRYSWSGSVCPSKYNYWTSSGQILLCDSKNNIFVIYKYCKDGRRNIDIPENIKNKTFIILAYWSIESLENKISKKFNNHGTVIVKKNKEKEYFCLQFCKPIDINLFIREFKNQIIIFDSGMYAGNSRNYSQFRSSKLLWDSITDEIY